MSYFIENYETKKQTLYNDLKFLAGIQRSDYLEIKFTFFLEIKNKEKQILDKGEHTSWLTMRKFVKFCPKTN